MPRFYPKAKTVLGRLLERTVKPNGDDGCWVWTGLANKDGYGKIFINKASRQVHRVSYELHNAEDIARLVIRHSCDNPPCWNPTHLVAGTHAQNVGDKVRRGRQRKGEAVPSSKLTAEQVLEIRTLCDSGMLRKDVAELYGTDPSNVGLIARRVSWKHI